MHKWKFGTLNIRSGKEKLEGARIYQITKQIAQENLTFCCLQEVKYRNSGKKIIELNNGKKFNFFWCGQKKRRCAGIGLLIKSERGITTSQPDYQDPRVMGVNLNIHGFKIRLVIGYSPTNISGSDSAKDEFYRTLKKVCENRPKNHKLIVCGDFNAETSLVYDRTEFDGSYVMHQDELCNDNGQRLKSFSRQFKLCHKLILSTHLTKDIHGIARIIKRKKF
jgi:exonuclease III